MNLIWSHPEGILSSEIYSYFNKPRGTTAAILHNIVKRECFVTDDVNKKRFYPTKNTFNESLNWNYVYKKPVSDISGARAYTQAIITIPGMEGTHTLFLFFKCWLTIFVKLCNIKM